jgi:type III restriction enzyme
MELLPFQRTASHSIAERFTELRDDPDRPTNTSRWAVPYYQGLNAITGAGKTAILADALSELRASLEYEPIVLWISKARAVVEQTLANFDGGGKYSHLLPDFVVESLSDVGGDNIRDVSTPLLLLTTVGTFNDNSREEGSRRFYRSNHDRNKDALNKLLRERPASDGERRPLVIVYDEGHNLTDQQTDLLLELEPDAILVASGTMKTPGKLGKLIDRLRDHNWTDDRLVTTVLSSHVVDAGLVKKQIILGGYASIMEAAIDDMIKHFRVVEEKAQALNIGFAPKAIYVCKTNVSQLDGTRDNPSRPFVERQAPPILIWRYLVEKKKVDPSEIAVYCDLRMDRKHNPPPADFIHFSGGDQDFGIFTAGNFRHVIFNQSLQEGWDDPECCFAYIDKSMGSQIQVHQVIGRVLRQPGAKHYSDADLNTAHFYIRIDDKQAFPAILDDVRKRIGAEVPEVQIEGFADRKGKVRVRREPRQVLSVPEIHIVLDPQPFEDAVDGIIDYSKDEVNVVGPGEKIRAVQRVGDGGAAKIAVRRIRHSNRVMARWIVRRTMQSLYPEAVKAVDWSLRKFDARVEITSPAAQNLRQSGEDLISTYLEHCDLVFEEENLYQVGPIILNPSKATTFTNALHEAYSDISTFEMPYAEAIDELGYPWVRNPSNGGYSIPLLKTGRTFNFYPDFLVWKDDVIFALDPKGAHLIREAAGRKLLEMRDETGRQKVVVRFLTEGKWESPEKQKSKQGVSVWSMGSGGIPRGRHYPSIPQAIEGSLRLR